MLVRQRFFVVYSYEEVTNKYENALNPERVGDTSCLLGPINITPCIWNKDKQTKETETENSKSVVLGK